jgi:hypothetical protein
MDINPVLDRLGLSGNARVVVFHADDIGMCQSTVTAYADLLAYGMLPAAAVMVPCPWFPAMGALARVQAGHARLDLGVHLTHTSEWQAYRWRPISIVDPASGLLDEEGYFHRLAAPFQQSAETEAVTQEMRAQVERALAAGIDITHIDSHMLALFHPRFLPAYLELANAYQVPALMFRAAAAEALASRYRIGAGFVDFVASLEDRGFPLFDHLHVMSLAEPEGRLEAAVRALEELPPGLSYFVIHPAEDTPELRAIAPDWRCRVADLALFSNPAWQKAVAAAGVHVVGFRVIRDLMRNA